MKNKLIYYSLYRVEIVELMSDGNPQGLSDISKTLSFIYDGFMEDLNRSKQKGPPLYRVDHIKK